MFRVTSDGDFYPLETNRMKENTIAKIKIMTNAKAKR